MKRFLMVVAALAIAASAYAESSPIPGATLTDEARKDRDVEFSRPDVINGTTSAGNALVSSANSTKGWNWLGIHVYLGEAGHGDSCGIAYVVVQVRAAYVSATDTMASAPYIAPNPSRGTSTIDTLGTTANHVPGVGSDVAGLPLTLMPGEYLIPIHYNDGKRSGYYVLPEYRSRYTIIRARTIGWVAGTNLGTTHTTLAAVQMRVDLQGGR